MAFVVIVAVYNAVFALLSFQAHRYEGSTVPARKSLAGAVVWNVLVLIPVAMVLLVRSLAGRAPHQALPDRESWRSHPKPRWFLKLTLTALLGLFVDLAIIIPVGNRLVPSINAIDYLCLWILLGSHTLILLSLALIGFACWLVRLTRQGVVL